MSFHFISAFNLTYEFNNGTVLFEDLDFSFGQHTYGLIGPNGVGKTTLLKILSREIAPTKGACTVRGKVAVLPQIHHDTSKDSSSLTIGQSVAEILNIHKVLEALDHIENGEVSPALLDLIGPNWDIQERTHTLFTSMGIGDLSLNRLAHTLSGGELVKVYLVKLLLESPEIVLLDEPTNNLDQGGREVLYEFIRQWRKCLIVVSHDRDLLSCVQKTVEFTNQGLQFYGGNYTFYLEEREKETLALEQKITTARQDEKRQKKELQLSLERQERRMNQGQRRADEGSIPKVVAGGLRRKAQATLARVKDTQQNRLLKAKQELIGLRNQIKEKNEIKIDMPNTEIHSKKEIFEIDRFNFRYFDSDSFLYANPISYRLVGPKRVSISGPNGSGKTTLIRVLISSLGSSPIREMGAVGEIQGTIQLKSHRVSYLDQKMEILGDGRKSLLELFSEKTPHLTESERRIRLGRFLFHQEHSQKKISVLSGGERMRAALACVLFSETPPELLILDEPTNNLDIDSVERMESALSNFLGAMLVISHDAEFLENIGISDQILIK